MTTPALVSGPGALSQRTDGGQPLRHIADAKYGEDKANIAQQKAAPLANSADQGTPPLAPSSSGVGGPGPGPAGGAAPSAPPQAITPFTAPTTNPDQHVTAGMTPFGGQPPRPSVKVQPNQFSQAIAPYVAADDSGILADFMWNLSQMGL